MKLSSMKCFSLFLILSLQFGVMLSETQAATVNLSSVDAATAQDYGPQDGIFDAIDAIDLGSVNNNGWTSLGTAFEFDISGIPAGAMIHGATLRILVNYIDGTRQIALRGYAGDGIIQLPDFSPDGLVANTTLIPPGSEWVTFDVTQMINDLVTNGNDFAGFNLREDPANTMNYLVLTFTIDPGSPVLFVDFSTEQIVDIDIKPGSVPNSINRLSKGKTPVAILSSPTFEAWSVVDTTSLTFGRTGDETSLAFCSAAPEDVNGDGLLDVMCHFDTGKTGLLLGDTQAVLKGTTLSGVSFKGTDSVRIVK